MVIAAKQTLDVRHLCAQDPWKHEPLWTLSESDQEALKQRSKGLVLTDDYAPIENLISVVARADSCDILSREYYRQARQLKREDRLEDCLRRFQDVLDIDPASSLRVYNEMGFVLLQQEKWRQAGEAFQHCLNFVQEENLMVNTGSVHWNLANALRRGGQPEQQIRQPLHLAVEDYRRALANDPRSFDTHSLLAQVLAALGRAEEALSHFQEAVSLNLLDVATHLKLTHTLEKHGKSKEAVEHLEATIHVLLERGRQPDAGQLKAHLKSLRAKLKDGRD